KESDAIRLANDTAYGLGASVWSSDLQKAKRTAEELDSGCVAINDVVTFVANPDLPFGGVKNSGIGRDHGEAGLRRFCHERSLLVDSGKTLPEVNWFPYQGILSCFRQLIRASFGDRMN